MFSFRQFIWFQQLNFNILFQYKIIYLHFVDIFPNRRRFIYEKKFSFSFRSRNGALEYTYQSIDDLLIIFNGNLIHFNRKIAVWVAFDDYANLLWHKNEVICWS